MTSHVQKLTLIDNTHLNILNYTALKRIYKITNL